MGSISWPQLAIWKTRIMDLIIHGSSLEFRDIPRANVGYGFRSLHLAVLNTRPRNVDLR